MSEQIDLKLSKNDQKLIEELYSTDDEVVLMSLDKIMDKGIKSLMPALIHVLSTSNNESIKDEIFCQLKDTASIEMMILFLQLEKYNAIHEKLRSALWQTAYDGSKFLSLFVQLAIQGDYLVCIDILSIIENMKEPFEDELIQDLIEQIEHAIPETEAKKSQLLFELTETIRNL